MLGLQNRLERTAMARLQNEPLAAADRRAIRAVADDGHEPCRKDIARFGKTGAARSARRE
jgi:hypothetical protein